MLALGLILIAWFTVVSLVLQYGPQLIEALVALIKAIRSRNADKARFAVDQAMAIAMGVVANLARQEGMTDAEKRDQAAKDIQATAAGYGIALKESDARLLAELAYKRRKEG